MLSGFFTLVESIYSDVVGTFVAIITPLLSKISGCLCAILLFLSLLKQQADQMLKRTYEK